MDPLFKRKARSVGNVDLVVEQILNHKDEIIAGKKHDRVIIISKNHNIWKIISDKLMGAIAPHSLYTFVSCDRYGVRSILEGKLINRTHMSNPSAKCCPDIKCIYTATSPFKLKTIEGKSSDS